MDFGADSKEMSREEERLVEIASNAWYNCVKWT